jgi:hypothetical protein
MPSFGDLGYGVSFPTISGDPVNRNNLLGVLSQGTAASSTSQSIWGGLISGGLGILNTYLQSKLNPSSPPPNVPVSALPAAVLNTYGNNFQAGAIIPAAEAAAGAMTRSGVLAALRALGAKIVGNVARVAPEIWASIPSGIKQAAAALGISIIADELVNSMSGGSSSGHRRRMNYLNPRAFNRSVRRIKGARKMLHKLEHSLPTRKVVVKSKRR